MRIAYVVLALCGLAASASAQDEKVEELLEQVEARLYSPRGAGLRSAQVDVKTPLASLLGDKTKVRLYWKAGIDDGVDQLAVKIHGTLPKMVKPSFAERLTSQVSDLAAPFFSSPLQVLEDLLIHGDSAIEKDGSKRRIVTLTRKKNAPESVRLSKAVLTINVKKMELEQLATTMNEQTITVRPIWRKRDDKLQMMGQDVKLDGPRFKTKGNRIDVTWVKRESGGKEVQVLRTLSSRKPKVSVRFVDYVLDQPIADDVWPKKEPAEEKPGGK